MMTFLSDWLRGLILVIFLAVILDMILPNNAMQRYAKLVMGLLIILLMLSPILKLSGKSIYQMDFTLDSLLTGGQHKANLPTLEQINAQGEQLRQQNQGLTAEAWKAGITQNVKQIVEAQKPGLTVDRVEVTYTPNEQGQPQTLDALAVTVKTRLEAGSVQAVPDVAPVVIGKSTDSADSPSTLAQADRRHAETAAAIRTQIAAEYKLTASQIRVVWRDS
ncbi:stage III sporulation protein AF [Tumebacillus permanentifrigoris]|uniref:Stage III sporulation protein AF n=1 Tax=Tumebacillus permanentifrigoris TaxID=378543 RepID=A0A316D994_9BACL|nr:stage III sporulation protein AF [Tumebacillus permanentifrigoris]PWK11502.1 stage III sporulation protein AF [Tumebacillus permanentifrigoris]